MKYGLAAIASSMSALGAQLICCKYYSNIATKKSLFLCHVDAPVNFLLNFKLSGSKKKGHENHLILAIRYSYPVCVYLSKTVIYGLNQFLTCFPTFSALMMLIMLSTFFSALFAYRSTNFCIIFYMVRVSSKQL